MQSEHTKETADMMASIINLSTKWRCMINFMLLSGTTGIIFQPIS
jgi:hypothetical protein